MADKPKGQQKILGMPRTTGIVVIGLGALVIGYFLISRMGGSSTSGSGSGTGSGGGRPGYASGGQTIVEIIKGHHGHKPRPKPKPRTHPKGK